MTEHTEPLFVFYRNTQSILSTSLIGKTHLTKIDRLKFVNLLDKIEFGCCDHSRLKETHVTVNFSSDNFEEQSTPVFRDGSMGRTFRLPERDFPRIKPCLHVA